MKSLRNPDRRPTHPGAVLREDILPALKMSQTELAALIGVSRLSVSELVHEKRAMSPEMAVRIATLLNTSPESWLRMQEAVDLWAVRQNSDKLASVKPLNKSRLDLAVCNGENIG
jgi:addiction module HigA family antidote